MKKSENSFAGTVAALFVIAITVAAVWGWVVNIIALAGNQGESFGLIALRVVGIFMAPLGAILGFAV